MDAAEGNGVADCSGGFREQWGAGQYGEQRIMGAVEGDGDSRGQWRQ